MAKLELDSYKQMSPQAVSSWLIGSFVVATSTAVAVLVIVTHHLARGPTSSAAAPVETIEVSSAFYGQ